MSNPVSSAFTYAHPASVYSSSGHQSTDADWLSSEPGPHSYSTPGLYAMQELPVPEPGGQGYDTTPNNAGLVGHYGSTSPSAFQSGSVSSPSMDTHMDTRMEPASAAAAADQQRAKASRKSSSSAAKKPKQEYPISPASASSGGAKPRAKKANLRTASRTSKNTHHNPPATEEERKSRESHNQVEKNYRERLNGHFKSLLDVLPEDLRSRLDDDDGGGGGGASERHSSKAEVLVMAKQYIRELEEKLARREEGREAERDVEAVRWFCAECEKQKGNHGW